MYPRLTLKIENHIPKIFLEKEEGNIVTVTEGSVQLDEVIRKIGERNNITHSRNGDSLEDLFAIAATGNERIVDELPTINEDSKNFDFEDLLMDIEEEIRDAIEEYHNVEMDKKVRAEIDAANNIDVFASLIEVIFNILVARVMIHSSDLGITNIFIEDQNGYIRLQQKLASELSKEGIELKFA